MSATAVAISGALSSVAARLTEPEDRATYAALVSYFNALPEHDEMFRLVELLGLLTLAGQRIPDAIAEIVVELRTHATAASAYHAQVDTRLASLPDEIAAGIDVEAMAKDMAESLRQQFATTGLQTTATLLRKASKEITALSGEISATLKPTAQEYKNVTDTICSELAKLNLASDELRRHNTQLIAKEQTNSGWLLSIIMLVIFLAGIVAGVYVEKS